MKYQSVLESIEKYGFAPDPVMASWLRFLRDRENMLLVQVGTSQVDLPQVRTVRLRELEEFRSFGFNTHIESEKFKVLKSNPMVGGCYFNPSDGIQYRFQACVEILDPTQAKYASILDRMWKNTRPDVRYVYWRDFSGSEANIESKIHERCPAFATLLCLPVVWDINETHPTDYSKERRTSYILEDNEGWVSEQISTLSGNPLFPKEIDEDSI